MYWAGGSWVPNAAVNASSDGPGMGGCGAASAAPGRGRTRISALGLDIFGCQVVVAMVIEVVGCMIHNAALMVW